MPAERVAANTDKIKALKEAPSARRKLHRGDGTHGDENSGPLEDLGRSIGMAVGGVFKNSERLDALPKERTPKDVLSDGYDSGGEAGSEQVLALLRSGVSARQSMDLNGASSEYKRAQHLQNGRKASRPTNKYTIWLRMLAKRHGKARLRTAALDIQRCYRGMLAREDAAWHRLQRRKQRAAQETVARQQRERGAARTLQRVMLGHRGRLQANWRRRKRAQRNAAAAVLTAALQRLAARGEVVKRRDLERKRLAEEQAREFLAMSRAAVALQRRCRARLKAYYDTSTPFLEAARAAACLQRQVRRLVLANQLGDLRRAEKERAEAEERRKDQEARAAAAEQLRVRRVGAATSLATIWRARLARAVVHARRQAAAAAGELVVQEGACVCLQVAWRGAAARRLLSRARESRRAAAREAAAVRWAAASRVQAVVKGRTVRRRVEGRRLREAGDARAAQAVTVLQQAWWAHVSRANVARARAAAAMAAEGQREAAGGRLAAGIAAWITGQRAGEEVVRRRESVRAAAAARIQGVVVGHRVRVVCGKWRRARLEWDQQARGLERAVAAACVARAWACRRARRQVQAARQRADESARALCARAAALLQACARRDLGRRARVAADARAVELQCAVRACWARRVLASCVLARRAAEAQRRR